MELLNTDYFISHHYESAGTLHIQGENFNFTVIGTIFAHMKTLMPWGKPMTVNILLFLWEKK